MTLNSSKKTIDNIVIIEIDSKSVEKLGQWPWNRLVYAKVLNYINKANPKAIGINILFSESTKSDNELINALKETKNVVTPFIYDNQSIIFPITEIKSITKVSDESIYNDKDGIVRKAFKNSSYLPEYKTFSTIISSYYNSDIISKIPEDNTFYINYFNTTNSFRHFSFYDVLTGKIKLNSFENKVVLIGITANGLSNNFNTPISNRLEGPISGIQLQAHIINTILSNRFIIKTDTFYVFILLFLSIILLVYLLKFKKVLFKSFITIIFVFLTLLTSFLMFKYLLIWLPPSTFIISFILIYLLFLLKTFLTIDKTVNKAILELSSDKDLPLPDISNQLEQGVLSLSEITHIINNDRQVIKAILNAINSPILVADKDSNIIWKNHQAKFIPHLNNILSLTDISIDFDQLKESVKIEKSYKQELMINDKEYLIISTPNSFQNSGYVCIFNDITEFKNLDRLKTDLIRTVSHEIRTPLTMMQLECEIAKEIGDLKTALTSIDNISDRIDDLTNLITDFLDLNKLEANIIQLKFVNLDIYNLLESIIAEIKELARVKNIKIQLLQEFKFNIEIQADKAKIKQVFINLISNAIKYSEDNKNVTIVINKDNSMIKISIIDEGFGISSNHLDKIFNKFYRIDSDETENITGTGLGLSIVKKIVEMHSGIIEVESIQGKGTTFTVYLPIQQPGM